MDAVVTKERTCEVVQGEYAEVCRQIGDRCYRRWVLKQEIAGLCKVAMELNREATALAVPEPDGKRP